ncbi:MAG: hypothetical protein HC830_03140, partial [Bacteroidetes bacterium]|nr:hypothetical protein [Bacteroidota bacterium]
MLRDVEKTFNFFTILLIAFLSYFSYKLLRENEVVVSSLLDAIPVDASFILEINRPQVLFEIINAPPIDAESFFNIPFIRDPLLRLKTIDSVTSEVKEVRSILRRPRSAMISGHPVRKDQLEYVYYLKLDNAEEYEAIDRLIRKDVQPKGNISGHNYEDARIRDVSIFNRQSEAFSYVYYRGMFIMSHSSILLEEVIRQTKSTVSIRTKAGLETLLKTAGKSSPFNIYINFEYFPTLALNIIHSRFKPELNAMAKFAHWIELDCNVNDNAIVFTGFSASDDTNGFLSDIFKDQEPFHLLLPGLLPASTKSFFALGISDYNKFRLNFTDYQRKYHTNPDFNTNLENYRKQTGTDLAAEFIKAFDNELSFAFSPSPGDTLSNNVFTIIRAKGTDEARTFIELCSDTVTSQERNTGTEIKSRIYALKSNIPRLLFGNIFNLNNNLLCVISDNYMIFGVFSI